MKRTYSADFINKILSHPAVKGGAKVLDGIDLSAFAESPENIFLVNDYGGFILLKVYPNTYEWHSQFLPEGRGPAVRECARESLDYVFTYTDAERLVTKAYKDNPASIKLAGEFMDQRGETPDYVYFDLLYSDWVLKEPKNLASGEAFHRMVDTNHDDDVTHDYYVGSAIRMCEAGNWKKGQFLYNQWAIMSGYECATLLNEQPPTFAIGSMTIEITGGTQLCL